MRRVIYSNSEPWEPVKIIEHREVDGSLMIVSVDYRNKAVTVLEPVRFIYSPTGESHGRGTDRYRWVSHLTPEEQRAVKHGHIIVIDKYVSDKAPAPVQVVIWQHGRYDHRVPTPDIMSRCLEVAGYKVAGD